jgi:hypothetical protein
VTDTHATNTTAQIALDFYVARNAQDNADREPASLFWIMEDGSREHAGDFTDLYFGLKSLANVNLPEGAVALGCYSTGWASPLTGDNVDESEKQRCSVVTICDKNFAMSSAVRIGDGEKIVESTDGEGAMADAIALTMMLSMRTSARERNAD